jgi:hypothetical protein
VAVPARGGSVSHGQETPGLDGTGTVDESLQVGDRVGIMDEADYRHWSRFGAVTAGPGAASALAATGFYTVQEDGRDDPIPVSADRLVKLGPPDASGLPGELSVQCFPIDGERPGLPMYFRTSADVLQFVRLFFEAGVSDEKLRVRVPSSANAAELSTLKNQKDVELI